MDAETQAGSPPSSIESAAISFPCILLASDPPTLPLLVEHETQATACGHHDPSSHFSLGPPSVDPGNSLLMLH